MRALGFSTGALAKGELSRGIEICRQLKLQVIELSALRLNEVQDLIDVVDGKDLSDFGYVSLHAPTDFVSSDEPFVAATFLRLAKSRNWPVVLHPDSICDFDLWRPLGDLLYVENMDKRKPAGRTLEELQSLRAQLPSSYICFDIAHARQVDSSMTESYRILRNLREEIREIHFSEITSGSRHTQVSESAFRAYREVASCIPNDVPVILESIVSDSPALLESAALELERVSRFFEEFVPLSQADVTQRSRL